MHSCLMLCGKTGIATPSFHFVFISRGSLAVSVLAMFEEVPHCEEGGLNTEVASHQASFPEATFGYRLYTELKLNNHIKGMLSATKHFKSAFFSQLSQEKPTVRGWVATPQM